MNVGMNYDSCQIYVMKNLLCLPFNAILPQEAVFCKDFPCFLSPLAHYDQAQMQQNRTLRNESLWLCCLPIFQVQKALFGASATAYNGKMCSRPGVWPRRSNDYSV